MYIYIMIPTQEQGIQASIQWVCPKMCWCLGSLMLIFYGTNHGQEWIMGHDWMQLFRQTLKGSQALFGRSKKLMAS